MPTSAGRTERPALAGLAVTTALLLSVVHFLSGHRRWIVPFFGDFAEWLADTDVAGVPAVPHWPGIVALGCAAAIAGSLAARLVVAGTALAHDRPARLGLTLILGPCAIGYAGVVALVFGELRAVVLLGVLAVEVVLLWCAVRRVAKGRHRLRGDANVRDEAPAARWWRAAVAFVATTTILLVLLHAIWTPVTEWDSVIYHAGTARLWFLGRPEPPLLFGPSLGIEISANYPPLFPSIGAAAYVLLGGISDIAVRVLSPIFTAGVVLLTFAYARSRFGSRVAWWSVLLLVGCPLFLLYGGWPTSYLLLTALTLAVVVLCDIAATTERTSMWVAAGVLAGLAVLTHFFGLLALLAGLTALWPRRDSGDGEAGRRAARRHLMPAVQFAATALVVAAPWLVRNLVRLRDPLYPLGAPLFSGRGLVEPLWGASRDEVRRNALGYWGDDPEGGVRVQQALTALFDRHLLPTGLLVGLALAIWWGRRRGWRLRYLVTVTVILVGVQLIPGWYWIRSLLPAMPVAAVLSGWALTELQMRVSHRSGDLPGLVRRLAGRAVTAGMAVIAVASATVGLSLAVAGPNQETWTTGLNSSRDLMRSVRSFGDEKRRLWTVYGGDLLAWDWLNAHIGQGERIATLDARHYYIDRPFDLLYLDGRAGVRLLNATTPDDAYQQLRAQRARYVVLPGWTLSPGPTRHPVVDVLPLMRFLGGEHFPLVGSFSPAGGDAPTLIYSVGRRRDHVVEMPYPGATAPIPRPGSSSFTFRRGQTDARVFLQVDAAGGVAVEFDYDDSAEGPFQINEFDPADRRWRFGSFSQQRTGTTVWRHVAVPVTPTSLGYGQLGVYAERRDLRVRGFKITRPKEPIASGTVAPTPGADHTFGADSVDGRILVPAPPETTRHLTFEYRSSGAERLDINVFDVVRGRWRLGLLSRAVEDDGAWRHVSVPVTGDVTGFAQVGIFASRGDLDVRGVDVASAVPRAMVSVLVLNGNGLEGVARQAASALAALGFHDAGSENADRQDYARTEIRYRPGAIDKARLVRTHLAGTLIEDPTLAVDVVLVLGRDFGGVHEPGATPTPPGRPGRPNPTGSA